MRIRNGERVGAVFALPEVQCGDRDAGLCKRAVCGLGMGAIVQCPDAAMQFHHHAERTGAVRPVEPCKKGLVAVPKKLNVFNIVFRHVSSNL